MARNHHTFQTFDVAASVRRNAGSAAFAAALMLYFGFFNPAVPIGTGLFAQCGWLLFYTLRIGGVLMALIAAWSWIGHRPALIVDAVVSVLIGLVFILAGGGMLIDGGGGFHSLLFLVFGAMFISAGVRNGRAYCELTTSPSQASGPNAASYDPGFAQRYEESREAPAGPSLAGRLLQRTDDDPEPQASACANEEWESTVPPSDVMPDPAPDETTKDHPAEEPETSPPPSDGFLAAFGKKDPSDED